MTAFRFAFAALICVAVAACATSDDETPARIKAGVDDAMRQCNGILSDPDLNTLRARTDIAKPSGITFPMLTINERANEQERPAILLWAKHREKCTVLLRTAWSADAFYTQHFMPMDEALFTTTQALLADLYRGEISWGQFNSARQANAARTRETRARVAADLEARQAEARERARLAARSAAEMADLELQQQQMRQQMWLQQMSRSRIIRCTPIGNTVFCN